MTEKDYSLLRPFDLEAAKRDELITTLFLDGEMVTHAFVTGPDDHGGFVVKTPDGWFRFGKESDYRMAPLAWVEGKPVYKGDVLYDRNGQKCVAKSITLGGTLESEETTLLRFFPELTWNQPKIGREGWVNIVEAGIGCSRGNLGGWLIRNGDIFPTEEAAKTRAAHCGDVIATVRIEWEYLARGAA